MKLHSSAASCLLLLICSSVFMSCNQSESVTAVPLSLVREHQCAEDGMILLDFHGPKAQILWKDGTRSFYCEAREAFPSWLNSIERHRILEFYVQDFSDVDWGSYSDRWIKAKNSVFVIDSRQHGAMGVSYVPFSDRAEAEKFISRNGGTIVDLDEIFPATLETTQELQRSEIASHHQHIHNHH